MSTLANSSESSSPTSEFLELSFHLLKSSPCHSLQASCFGNILPRKWPFQDGGVDRESCFLSWLLQGHHYLWWLEFLALLSYH